VEIRRSARGRAEVPAPAWRSSWPPPAAAEPRQQHQVRRGACARQAFLRWHPHFFAGCHGLRSYELLGGNPIMPGWRQTTSHSNPVAYVVDALRTLMLLGSTSAFVHAGLCSHTPDHGRPGVDRRPDCISVSERKHGRSGECAISPNDQQSAWGRVLKPYAKGS
jgi:hypothetical protein